MGWLVGWVASWRFFYGKAKDLKIWDSEITFFGGLCNFLHHILGMCSFLVTVYCWRGSCKALSLTCWLESTRTGQDRTCAA